MAEGRDPMDAFQEALREARKNPQFNALFEEQTSAFLDELKAGARKGIDKVKERHGWKEDRQFYVEMLSELGRSWLFWRAARRGDLTMTLYWGFAEWMAHLRRVDLRRRVDGSLEEKGYLS